MKRIARRNAVALAATVASCTLLAPLQARAGSAGPDGTDYVVSADANEEYVVEAPIDAYARVVKKGAGKVRLTTTTESYAGDVVIEEGALYFVTVGQNVQYLNGALTGSVTGSSQIFRKQGSGTLYVNGNVDLPRDVQIDQGLLAMNSTASRVFGGSFVQKGGSRVQIGDGHALFKNTIYLGLGNNNGVFHQTGGLLGVTGEAVVGGNKSDTRDTGAGHWVMSGGEAYVSNTVYVAYAAGNFGSFIQTGGLFKLEGGTFSAGRGGSAVFHLAGGTNDTRVVQGGQNVRFYLSDYGGSSDVTVSGEGTLLATEKLRFAGGGTISTNIFNVKDGATVKAARFFKQQSANAATRITVNADGGTLMPTFGYDWTDAGLSDAKYCPDHFVVWKKGLVIDTSESTGTKPASQMPFSFASPTGKGVESITLPTDGDYTTANYIGPARIVFEDATGWGASAYAEYDYDAKRHTRIVLTSRGCDYSDNAKAYVESPDRKTRWECALTLSDNAGLGGELVKRGQHDLYLYAANTTTGGIAVEEGTLFAETAGVVPSGTPVRVEHGATLQLPDATPITVSSFAGAGTLAAATGGGIAVTVTGAVRAKCADLFAGRFEAFPDLLTFAPGATFTITDPENLATYSHSPAVTAFTALRGVAGAPRLAFEGDVPPGSGLWSFTAKGDGTYTFGPVLGTLILVR